MSGGSLEYVYRRVEDAVDYIRDYAKEADEPTWAAFADHLALVAEALHDVEWVMSCDMGKGDADEAIAKVLLNDGEA